MRESGGGAGAAVRRCVTDTLNNNSQKTELSKKQTCMQPPIESVDLETRLISLRLDLLSSQSLSESTGVRTQDSGMQRGVATGTVARVA